MKDAKIFVVTPSPAFRRRAARALASTGARVGFCPYEDPASYGDLFVVDADTEPEIVLATLRQLAERDPVPIPLIVSTDMRSGLLAHLVADQGINNLIARHGGLAATDELFDEQELIITCNKLWRREIFGLDKHIFLWGLQTHNYTVASKQGKNAATDALEAFLERIQCYRGLVPMILSVADELLMNAMYSAPRDAEGRAKYNDKDRKATHDLDATEAVELSFVCDGRYVALSVGDRFGSLHRDVIVGYLQPAILGLQGAVKHQPGGAGLGLHLTYASVTQLIFNVHRGIRTEVIALFYVRSGARAFKSSGRSLNLFFIREP